MGKYLSNISLEEGLKKYLHSLNINKFRETEYVDVEDSLNRMSKKITRQPSCPAISYNRKELLIWYPEPPVPFLSLPTILFSLFILHSVSY